MTSSEILEHDTVPRVLLVEDDPAQARGVLELLGAENDYRLDHVTTLTDAVRHLERYGADVVLLDLTLPDSQGLESASRVRQVAPGSPVIVITGVRDEELVTEAARLGVQDYLVKGTFVVEALERTIRVALERARLQRLLETTNARLEEEVRTDPLTATLNRRGLAQVLEHQTARLGREGGGLVGILLDLDDFKRINDVHGYAAGDTVLVETVRRIRDTLRRTDHLSRVGGDEFLALLPNTRLAEARMLAEKLRLAVSGSAIELDDEEIFVTVSLGLLTVEDDTIEELLERGGSSLRLSKLTGKDRVSGDAGGHAQADGEVGDVALALAEAELAVLACPVVRVDDEEVVGIELFTRSSVPGFESPLAFFHVDMSSDLLSRLDLRCLEASSRARRWCGVGESVHVNLMPSTLVEIPVAELVERLRVPGDDRQIVVDLSEGQLVGDPSYLLARIGELRQAGVAIALDDCELSRGCLEALVALRPEILKVRPRLLRSARADEGGLDHLRRLLAVGRGLGCANLVEGVSDPDDLVLLRELGVTLAQGELWPRYDLTGRSAGS